MIIKIKKIVNLLNVIMFNFFFFFLIKKKKKKKKKKKIK